MQMNYEQAAVIIPKDELQLFFSRHGFKVTKPNPTATDIATYIQQVVREGGEPVILDLKEIASKNAKRIGGCACGGDCKSCKSAKTHNAEGGGENKPSEKKTSFVKEHSTLLIAGGILIALALILRKS